MLVLSLAYAVPDVLPHEDAVELAWDLLIEQELRGVQPPAVSRAPWRQGLVEYLEERLDGLRALGGLTDATSLVTRRIAPTAPGSSWTSPRRPWTTRS
jgi:hypothetical protein